MWLSEEGGRDWWRYREKGREKERGGADRGFGIVDAVRNAKNGADVGSPAVCGDESVEREIVSGEMEGDGWGELEERGISQSGCGEGLGLAGSIHSRSVNTQMYNT